MQVYWQGNRDCEGLPCNGVNTVWSDKHLCVLWCSHTPNIMVFHGGTVCAASAAGLSEEPAAAPRCVAFIASDFVEF